MSVSRFQNVRFQQWLCGLSQSVSLTAPIRTAPLVLFCVTPQTCHSHTAAASKNWDRHQVTPANLPRKATKVSTLGHRAAQPTEILFPAAPWCTRVFEHDRPIKSKHGRASHSGPSLAGRRGCQRAGRLLPVTKHGAAALLLLFHEGPLHPALSCDGAQCRDVAGRVRTAGASHTSARIPAAPLVSRRHRALAGRWTSCATPAPKPTTSSFR
jgi:hypothetical protein